MNLKEYEKMLLKHPESKEYKIKKVRASLDNGAYYGLDVGGNLLGVPMNQDNSPAFYNDEEIEIVWGEIEEASFDSKEDLAQFIKEMKELFKEDTITLISTPSKK